MSVQMTNNKIINNIIEASHSCLPRHCANEQIILLQISLDIDNIHTFVDICTSEVNFNLTKTKTGFFVHYSVVNIYLLYKY